MKQREKQSNVGIVRDVVEREGGEYVQIVGEMTE